MKQLKNDNAANRTSYVGYVYNVGEKEYKNKILNSLPKEWADLHRTVQFIFMIWMLMI